MAPQTVIHSSGRAWQAVVLGVLVAWAIPAVLHLVHLDALFPPILLIATASLLRSGRSLLDRLLIAVILLLGATCLAGLVFSVWPWHLAPLPIAGLAGTVLVGFAFLARRRPSLPKPTWGDAIAVGAAALVTATLAWPYLSANSTADLFAHTIVGGDNARHLQAVQAIRAIGGYLFLDPTAAAITGPSGMIYYPQGWHLTVGLLDNFWHSGQAGTAIDSYRHYQFASIATYGLFALMASWAVGWIAGRALTVPRRLVATALVVAVLIGSQIVRAVTYGYTAEMMGLAVAAFLIAILSRPLRSTREQLLAVSLGIVSLGFSYYLFLPAMAMAAVIWLIRKRRDVLRHKVMLTVALVLSALAVLPPVIGLVKAGQGEDIGSGPIVPSHKLAVGLLGVLIVVALASQAGRRSRVWRGYAWVLVSTAVFICGMVAATVMQGQSPRYFTGKSIHLVVLELAIGAGAITVLLPAPWRRRPAMLGRVAVAWVLTLAVAIGIGSIIGRGVFAEKVGNKHSTWVRFWVSGKGRPDMAATILRAAERTPPSTTQPTMIVADNPTDSYMQTLFLSALHRTAGVDDVAIYKLPYKQPNRLATFLDRTKGPVRLVPADAKGAALIEQVLAEHPEWRTRVTVIPLT